MREYDPNHRYQVITCASADFTDEDMSFRTVAGRPPRGGRG